MDGPDGLRCDFRPDSAESAGACGSPASSAFLYLGLPPGVAYVGSPPSGARLALRCPSCPPPTPRFWTAVPLDEASVLSVMSS